MSRTRALVIVILGSVALGAALIAARGPATAERVVYSWPPAALPSSSPTRTWFAPLLLAYQSADTLDATLPCADEEPLRGAQDPVLVVGTARDTVAWNALEVTRSRPRGQTTVRVGDRELAQLVSRDAACSLRLRIAGLDWSLARDGKQIRRGELRRPVGVTGLFTQLDLRERPGLHVAVHPVTQDTDPSGRQTLFRILAFLSVSGAVLALVPWPRTRPKGIRVARPHVAAQDLVVASCLAIYWVLAPLQDDDGWVRARQTNSVVSGGFSSYYQQHGVNVPLITWFEWLQRFVVAHTGSLVLDRLPSIAILATTWILGRGCLRSLLGREPSRGDVAWWSAAAAFALGAAAFGMTLRPEPAIALLGTAVLACCIRYVRAPSLLPVAAALLMSGAALTIHHSGAVAASPLLVCIPRIYGNAKRGIGSSPLALLGVFLTGVAWTAFLEFLDSDIDDRRNSIAEIRLTDPSAAQGPFDELDRYRRLLDLGGTPIRREFVVLLVLVVVVAILGRFWRRTLLEKLPAASIALCFLLLTLTTSKWIWHFGALVGLCTVAVGVEVDRLGAVRPSAVVRWAAALVVLATGLWAARGSFQWTTFETGSAPSWNSVPYVPVLLAAAGAALVLLLAVRRSRPDRRAVPVGPALALFFAVVVALLGTTTVALAVEAARTPAWTAPRQAVSALAGRGTCGMADGLTVPAVGSIRPLARLGGSSRPIPGDTAAADPWLRIPRGPIGLMVSEGWSPGEEPLVTFGKKTTTGVRPLASGVLPAGDASMGFVLTRRVLIGDGSFPRRPAGADAVRLEWPARGTTPRTAPIGELVSFGEIPLAARMRESSVRTLVTPYLFEGIPCAALPVLRYGLAEVPDLIVEGDLWPAATGYASPFSGVSDAYDVTRVPVANWDTNRGLIYVYAVVTDPRDAVAPATRLLVTA